MSRKRIAGIFVRGLVVMALLVPALSAAQAQSRRGMSHQQDRGQKSEQEACEPDVMRLCKRVSQSGDLIVLKCLQQNRAKLSRACQRVLDDHGV